jgi:hypothetical protein
VSMLALAAVLSGIWLFFTGCGGSGGSNSGPPPNSGTPAGTYSVSVNVADSAGGPKHTLTINVTVQ